MPSLIFSLVLGLSIHSSNVYAQFAGGTGTVSEPYQIANVTQLQLAGSYLTSSFVLINNIDATVTVTWNSGSGFIPIGNASTYFRGNFNGAGFKITGLTINRPTTDRVGLFGVHYTGLISNLILENVSITGRKHVGALVAEKVTNIENCTASGAVTGTENVGGLVGSNYGAISSCNASCTVSGTSKVGGLIGSGAGTGVSDCFSTGNVSGTVQTGGFIGGIDSNGGTVQNCHSTGNVSTTGSMPTLGGFVGRMQAGTITNCYATGNVTGGQNNGGFIGQNQGIIEKSYSTGSVSVQAGATVGGFVAINEGGRINNCYTTSNVTKNSPNNFTGYAGGFAGRNQKGTIITNAYSAGTVTSIGGVGVGGFAGSNEISTTNNLPDSGKIVNSFWNLDISGQAVGAANSTTNAVNTKVTGLSTASMRQIASFVGWDFTSIWTIDEGATYPYFRTSSLTNSLINNEIKKYENLKVYCVKSKQSLQIQGVDFSNGVFVRILSVDGKTIYSKKTDASSIDISTLNKGVYLIELTDNKGLAQTAKFIKI